MGDRYQQVVKETRNNTDIGTPNKTTSQRPPTMSFKEAVAAFDIAPGKLKAAFRFDANAPQPVLAFNNRKQSNVYYVKTELVAFIKANINKLKKDPK